MAARGQTSPALQCRVLRGIRYNLQPGRGGPRGRALRIKWTLDFPPLSDIVGPFKLALTETNPHSGGQRGTRLVEGSHDTRRLYHSRAARDDRAGLSVTGSHKRPVATLRASAAASCSTLCRTCRRALPDRSFGLRVLRLSCRASVRLWQAGWNRGTYDSASP